VIDPSPIGSVGTEFTDVDVDEAEEEQEDAARQIAVEAARKSPTASKSPDLKVTSLPKRFLFTL
jgi:hypothetical protein